MDPDEFLNYLDTFELPAGYDTTVHYGDEAFELTGIPLCGKEDMADGFASDDPTEVSCHDCALLLMHLGKLPG